MALLLLTSSVPAARGDPGRPTPEAGPRLRYDFAAMLADDPLPSSHDSARLNAPAPPFRFAAEDSVQAERAVDCLTAAVYYEARSEGEAGQRAVAQVVLNRVRHRDYPRSVCGVVYQRARGRPCQFTFTCDGSMRARREPAAWAEARRIAREALDGSVYAPVGLATHYHTQAVRPGWGRRLAQVATIGAHIFYRSRSNAALTRVPAPLAGSPDPVVRLARAAPPSSSTPEPRPEASPEPPRPPAPPSMPEPGFAFLAEVTSPAPAGAARSR